MYGRQMGQMPQFQRDPYEPMSPEVPGVLSQMPYQQPVQTAWLNRLVNRSKDVDAAVAVPEAKPAAQKQSKVFQGQDGGWYYMGRDGSYRPTKVIHNPETGAAFYWDDDARDFVPAE